MPANPYLPSGERACGGPYATRQSRNPYLPLPHCPAPGPPGSPRPPARRARPPVVHPPGAPFVAHRRLSEGDGRVSGIAFWAGGEPAGGLRDPAHRDPPLPLQLAEQRLRLVAAEAGEDLLELSERRAACGRVVDVPRKQRLVGLAVEPLSARVGAGAPEKPIEPAREQVTRAAPSAHALDHPMFKEDLSSRDEVGRNPLLRRWTRSNGIPDPLARQGRDRLREQSSTAGRAAS